MKEYMVIFTAAPSNGPGRVSIRTDRPIDAKEWDSIEKYFQEKMNAPELLVTNIIPLPVVG